MPVPGPADAAVAGPAPESPTPRRITAPRAPWPAQRVSADFEQAAARLEHLGPAVSVFGSARTTPGHPEYRQAAEVGRLLALAGFAVVTGGGPGVMEAANRGALEAGGYSVGLGIELPREQRLNDHLHLGVNFRYFFARKAMFIRHSLGFIVLPGGFGTLDEVFEAVTLMQTRKLAPGPIVLLGAEYWSGLVDWLHGRMVAQGKATGKEVGLLSLADSPQEAVDAILRSPAAAEARVPDGDGLAAEAEAFVPGARLIEGTEAAAAASGDIEPAA